jgi:general secretion pathway protein A
LKLFTYPALWSIYRISGGYPRKIINLCHQCILTMIIQNRSKIGYKLVRACSRRVFTEESHRWKKISATAALASAAAAIVLLLLPFDRLKSLQPWRIRPAETVMPIRNQPENDLPEVIVETPAVQAPIVPMDAYALQTHTESTVEADRETQDAKTVAEPATVAVPPLNSPAPDDEVDLTAETRYSETLGTITLKRHETLSGIIQRVYGDFNSKYFKLLISANPDIVDPDRVIVGQAIALPAIPVAVTLADNPHWWIRINETDTLEAGFNLLRDNPDGSLPIRLIPYWSPVSGIRFAVVLKELFKDERSALAQMAQLPPELSSKSMIFSFWNEDYVFFADPFFGQKP